MSRTADMKLRSISATWLATAFVGFQGIFAILPSPTVIAQSPVIPAFNFSVFPECNGTTTGSSQTVVPKLADSFSVKVEGKHAEWAFFDSEGYYDKNGQRGATYVLSQGNTTSYLYDFVTGNAFSVTGDDNDYMYNGRTCEKENLWATGCNTYAYFIAEVAGSSNISYNCNFTASNIADQGVQNTTVRAIKVQMWDQCVHDNKQNVTWRNRYYYTAPGVVSPSTSPKNPKQQTPIRFESLQLDGVAGKGNIAIYDFTYYLPEVKDPSVFLPDPGVYCPGWARENQTIPKLPDFFSLTMLTLAKKERDVHSLRMSFDFMDGLVSYITDSANGTHFPPSAVKNRTLIRVVHDYNSGLSFSMSMETWLMGGKECTIGPIDAGSLDTSSTSSGAVHLKNAWELFGLNRSTWLYVGEREYNDMPTYVWVSQRFSYNNATKQNITVTTETYWLNETWSASNERVLVGIIIYRTLANGTVIETYQSTITDFNFAPINWKSFDVADCLRSDKQQLITFCMKVDNYTDLRPRMRSFETGIRDALANLTGTSPLQYGDIQVMKGEELNQPHIWVTVLDWANATTVGLGTTKNMTAVQVVKVLEGLFGTKDLPFVIKYKYAGKNESVTFIKDTLKSGNDLVRPTTPYPVPIPATTSPATPGPATTGHPGVPTAAPIITQEGYTSGSMAGLAIAMILIGGVAGLVAGFLLWKRNAGIAYQVYD